jgi:hypothetical protein
MCLQSGLYQLPAFADRGRVAYCVKRGAFMAQYVLRLSGKIRWGMGAEPVETLNPNSNFILFEDQLSMGECLLRGVGNPYC